MWMNVLIHSLMDVHSIASINLCCKIMMHYMPCPSACVSVRGGWYHPEVSLSLYVSRIGWQYCSSPLRYGGSYRSDEDASGQRGQLGGSRLCKPTPSLSPLFSSTTTIQWLLHIHIVVHIYMHVVWVYGFDVWIGFYMFVLIIIDF